MGKIFYIMTKRKVNGQPGKTNLCLKSMEMTYGMPVRDIVKEELGTADVTLSAIETRQYVGINVFLTKQKRYKAICRVFFPKNNVPKLAIYDHKCKRVMFKPLKSPKDIEKYREDIKKYAKETKLKRGV